MLAIALLQLFACISCFAAGIIFYQLIPWRGAASQQRPLIMVLITGMVCLSFFDQLLVLVIPVNQQVAVWLLLSLAAIMLIKKNQFTPILSEYARKARHAGIFVWMLAGMAWLLFLLLSSGPIIMDDTGSYHIQSIKWIQQYGTVPGLANLHERYGFNSSWFSFVALFTPGSSKYNYFSALNGMLSTWMTVHFICVIVRRPHEKDAATDNRRRLAALSILIIAFVAWPLLRGNATNSNYDFVSTMVLIILADLLLLNGTNGFAQSEIATEWVLWPVFLVSVRLTNFPLLLLCIPALIRTFRISKRWTTSLVLTASVMIASLAIRNVLLSGYIAYPFYHLDLFNVDWKADIEPARQIAHFIKYYNRIHNEFVPISQTARLTGLNWMPYWLYYLEWYDKLILALAISGYAVFFIRHFRQKQTRPIFFFAVVMLLQLAVWMMVAPDPRFAYGALLCGIYFLASDSVAVDWYTTGKKATTVVMIFFCAVLLVYGLHKAASDSNYRRLTVPVLLPTPLVRTVKLNNMLLYLPEKLPDNWNPRCYGTALPCLYEIRPGLQLRTGNLKDGFKIAR